jgi:hypothetical protein
MISDFLKQRRKLPSSIHSLFDKMIILTDSNILRGRSSPWKKRHEPIEAISFYPFMAAGGDSAIRRKIHL